jgi:hypothetical protein
MYTQDQNWHINLKTILQTEYSKAEYNPLRPIAACMYSFISFPLNEFVFL